MPMTIQERIEAMITRSPSPVFLRKDFAKFGGYDQVGRALRGVVKKGMLVRSGQGIYAKARKSSLSGNPVPVVPLQELGLRALAKLGVKAQLGSAARAYNEGRTTQIPMRPVLDVGRSRVTRKIGFGSQTLQYERG